MHQRSPGLMLNKHLWAKGEQARGSALLPGLTSFLRTKGPSEHSRGRQPRQSAGLAVVLSAVFSDPAACVFSSLPLAGCVALWAP